MAGWVHPAGSPGPWRALRDGLRPGSVSQLVVLRVGIAALVSGIAAGLLDLERAYWAVAASVLILHAGMDRVRTLQRGFERMAGTWVGLLLAGLVLAVHPQGLWLVLIVMALQFTIEVTVMRNYALAAVFITTVALTIAASAQKVAEVPGMLLARGVDTTIGCCIALLVFVLVTPRATPTRIPAAMLALFTAARPVVDFLATNQTGTPAAHEARFKLQTAIFALRESFSTAMGGSTAQRRTAEQSWPAVSTAQSLAYALLSACWLLEQHDGGTPSEATAEISADLTPGTGGAEAIAETLEILATAVRNGVKPAPLPALPRFLRRKPRPWSVRSRWINADSSGCDSPQLTFVMRHTQAGCGAAHWQRHTAVQFGA
ncbi:FUSC family protein [Arthrobacter alpinus]|nr:FUSC family protein [Arthrobacter alpinus]